MERSSIRQISEWLWEIPRSFRGDMRVPARFYASGAMLGPDQPVILHLIDIPDENAMKALNDGLEAWGVPEKGIHYEAFGPATVKKKAAPASSCPSWKTSTAPTS